MILIVGLGNPGKKYQKTRHNLGFMVIEEMAQKWQIPALVKKKFKSIVYENRKRGVILAKPQTMMNNSGLAVSNLTNFYKVKLENLWVIHDDLDLPLGRIKAKKSGGTAGHRGLESIIEELGNGNFVRFRLGIGHPGIGLTDQEIRNYVLLPFKPGETKDAQKVIKKAAEAIKKALEKGLEVAMNEFN